MVFISEVLSYLYSILSLNFFGLIKYYDRSSTNVLWVKWPLKRLILPDLGVVYDLVYINYLISNKISFRIVTDSNIGYVHNAKVFVNLSRAFNSQKFDDWGQVIENTIKMLEHQGCKVGPNSHEAALWEDKITMHNLFGQFDVKCPKTIICKNFVDIENQIGNLNFPIITKIPHGAGSMGIKEFTLFSELKASLSEFKYPLLLQERIDMTMDARIVFINFEYFDHYFRVNQSDKWHPTSTSKGSKLEYFGVPEKVLDYLSETTVKLNLRVAAYDVAWFKNDLSGDFTILEVSPAYLPNPRYNGTVPFKDWKKIFWKKKPFWKELIKTLQNHRFKQLETYISK